MYLDCTIRIEERLHLIRVAVPDHYGERDLKEVVRFAVISALLEHSGYLPSGVTHAVA